MMASLKRNTGTLTYLLIKFAIVSIVVLLVASCSSNYGTKLKFKKGELFYTENAKKEDAEKLGKYLTEKGFYSDDKETSGQLDAKGDTVLFRFVTIDSYLDKPDFIDIWKRTAADMSQQLFNNKPVTIHFCDKYLKTERVIPM
ncbi:MAG TPA: hypothetical protein VHM26_19250 [Chitinophagaceae bacterium]|jgi:hypothetical protein|nr:hypothetical protein [Chitinophagaceae bacterium]